MKEEVLSKTTTDYNFTKSELDKLFKEIDKPKDKKELESNFTNALNCNFDENGKQAYQWNDILSQAFFEKVIYSNQDTVGTDYYYELILYVRKIKNELLWKIIKHSDI